MSEATDLLASFFSDECHDGDQLLGFMKQHGLSIASTAAARAAPAPAPKPVPYDRSVFLYMEPRIAIDGPDYFARCGSCVNFIPENAMHGAVAGDRCALFGSGFPITDDSSCGLYAPNADGQPCAGCVKHAAEEIIEGCRGSVDPWVAGFVRDERVQCQNCFNFDYEAAKCKLFAGLNAAAPERWALTDDVLAGACCNGWMKYPDAAPT